MLTEEHGIQKNSPNAIKAASVTFLAFIIVGVMPLIPFMFPGLNKDSQFIISAFLAAIMFFSIGTLKSFVFAKPVIRSGVSTLLTGGAAAALAFLVGSLLREMLGIASM